MAQVRDELVGMIDRALGDDPNAALVAAHQLGLEVEWLTKKAVALARVNGYGWGRIGRLLQMTRQGARKRFPLAPPIPPPHVVRENRTRRETRAGEVLLERWRQGLPLRGYSAEDDDDPVAW
ncbi:MAG: hypothetical protein Q7V88_06755 [Actinomycetota bacterium]|nr:hypothetical protein [Actinomycetota bacterium]